MKVVIAEDDLDIARLVAFKLRAAGHDVTIAPDGAQGLEAVQRERPGLLLLDVTMPVMDGWTVLAKLRADEHWRRLNVVMLTAQGQERDQIRGRAAGAQDYIVKPFAIGELLPRLDKWLREQPAPPPPPPPPPPPHHAPAAAPVLSFDPLPPASPPPG